MDRLRVRLGGWTDSHYAKLNPDDLEFLGIWKVGKTHESVLTINVNASVAFISVKADHSIQRRNIILPKYTKDNLQHTHDHEEVLLSVIPDIVDLDKIIIETKNRIIRNKIQYSLVGLPTYKGCYLPTGYCVICVPDKIGMITKDTEIVEYDGKIQEQNQSSSPDSSNVHGSNANAADRYDSGKVKKENSQFAQDRLEVEEWIQSFIQSPEIIDQLPYGLDAVSGFDEAKKIVKKYINYVSNPDIESIKRRHPKYKPPRGLILFGPQGCGKTFFASALAKETKDICTFFLVSGIRSHWHGQDDELISALFRVAFKRAPSILFIDEIEDVAANRKLLKDELEKKIVRKFLIELDGFRRKLTDPPVLLIGTTNVLPDQLDGAFIRPGRTDSVIYIELPESKMRKNIFQYELESEEIGGLVDYDKLAELSEGYSGADIASICLKTINQVVEEEESLNNGKHELPTKRQLEILYKCVTDHKPSVSVDDVNYYRSAVEKIKR